MISGLKKYKDNCALNGNRDTHFGQQKESQQSMIHSSFITREAADEDVLVILVSRSIRTT